MIRVDNISINPVDKYRNIHLPHFIVCNRVFRSTAPSSSFDRFLGWLKIFVRPKMSRFYIIAAREYIVET